MHVLVLGRYDPHTHTHTHTHTVPHPSPQTLMPVDSIRALFPALSREIDGHPVAHFDGPGGTQVPEDVLAAVRAQMVERNGNAGWNVPTAQATDAMMADARSTFATLFNARDPDEIVFGANMTTLALRLAHALGRRVGRGDEIVVTELDHHANVDSWRMLEHDRGAVVRVARFDPETGDLDMDDLESKLSSRTRLLAIGAASNALGTIIDVTRATRAAHDAGALVFVDAVHYAPHELVDVQALGADMLAASAYKFYGPHVGAVYLRADLLEELDVPRVVSAPAVGPGRIETGTLNFEGIAGAAAAVRFIARHGGASATGRPAPGRPPREDGEALRARLAAAYAAGRERGASLLRRMWHGLDGVPGVRLYGPPPGGPRTPTVAFTIEGVHPRDAAGRLGARGVLVSHGDFYAASVVDRLRLREAGGLIRAGCAIYTTESEVDRLVDGVAELASSGSAIVPAAATPSIRSSVSTGFRRPQPPR
ncbi:MAG TPA: cysteine desulfurase-like protein [Longimicrobiales bacterium]|nr:cysteine desulfurase-like protein [Longimicrobiales bacterium]